MIRYRTIGAIATVLLAASATARLPGAEPNASHDKTIRDEARRRDELWNSPAMVQARAWMDDYFAASAKVTAEQAGQYRQRLQAMSARELTQWLADFEQNRQAQQQQEAAWQQARQFLVGQTLGAVHRQDFAANQYNVASGGAAEQQQQRFAAQQSLQNQMILQRNAIGPFTSGRGYAYGLYPFWASGFYPW